MAENWSHANESHGQADDFKLINGIKKGMESRLHASGVQRYAQLAALTPEEILARLGKAIGYTTRRIAEEDWAGQAAALATQAEALAEQAALATQAEADTGMFRQHYATFTVEVLLGEENDVRRTRMLHIQSDTEETWAGWDEQRLTRFISQNAHVNLVAQGVAERAIEDTRAPSETQAIPRPAPISGWPQVREVAVIPVTGGHHRVVAERQPFEIDLTVDLTEVHAASATGLAYHATAVAKDLGSGARLTLAGSQGTCAPGETTSIQLNSQGLPCGTYRLGIDLAMSDAASPETQADLSTAIEGGLLQVY